MKSKHKFFFLLTLSYFLLNCSNKNAEVEDYSSKEKLNIAIETFNNAFQKGDINTLEEMITTNYIHTNSSSKAIRKESWFQYLKKRAKEIKLGQLEVLYYKMDQIETVFHNKTAIVTARVYVSSKRDSTIKENSYRVTNIWVYKSGNWKRAAFHDGKIN